MNERSREIFRRGTGTTDIPRYTKQAKKTNKVAICMKITSQLESVFGDLGIHIDDIK